MIYILIGTKGQFMKTFPVMQGLDKRRVPYQFIHICQHYHIIENTRKRLGIRKPDIYLTMKKRDLANIWELLCWAPHVLWNARKLPITKHDYVLIHGDAESTILGFLIAKWFGARIVHLESGIRSWNFFEPFPEEITRTVVSRYSDISFCPYQRDADTIKRKQSIFITNGNTALDSARLALQRPPSNKIKQFFGKKYVLITFHRKENLFNKERLHRIIRILEEILRRGFIVIWPIHTNTVFELKKQGVWQTILELKRKFPLVTSYLFDYVDFMHAVRHSQFVASDSGGLQTETFVLNTPMLILREVIEQDIGIGETAYLSKLEMRRVVWFLNSYRRLRRHKQVTSRPSDVVVDFFYNTL
ncbi:UDP-N-acetylglucosamine 2-epimerase [Candidatus Gottesmanbacteria bacterium]|nr:UDP-N-acetylglucosamine 2-epimerase [Candidatus Gottesmanbacteria bacterium]